jgi:hypothetical protein
VAPLERVDGSEGVWRTTEPVPVSGDWKAILRLHDGRTLAALPVYLPEDEAIPAEEVPAPATFVREFVSDKELLQREFTGGPLWLELVAYLGLAGIAAGWIWLVSWGLGRLLVAPVPVREAAARRPAERGYPRAVPGRA